MGLASRGRRDMDTGVEVIADAAELAQVRRQARVIHVKALVLAAALEALVLVIAPWR